MSNNHDFSDPDVRAVRALSVYSGRDGDVIIRMERDWSEVEDPFVVIPVAHAETVIAAIRREVEALKEEQENAP